MTTKNKRKRQRLQRNRKLRLDNHDFKGWTRHTEYHYQRSVNGFLVDWWPTRNKAMVEREVYRVFDESDINAITQELARVRSKEKW